MGLLDAFLQKQLDKISTNAARQVIAHVDDEVLKASAPIPTYLTGVTGGKVGPKRYQFSQDMINGGVQRRKKPGSDVSFETLRRFSISHEISRACINLRKRQITSMDWAIGTAEDDDTGSYNKQIAEVTDFFEVIGGRGIGYRRFMDRFIEDLLVLDAVSLEKQGTRGGQLRTLIPIDGATIRLRVDESGATPEPPEAAYVQVIRGQVTAEWTDDEMVYTMMNSRNDTPYGLAPLESLMIIVTSSLKSGMYNLAYLTDGNIPEGFYSMPENWTPQQIKEFQEYFDALLAGDETATRRLKFMPPGKYDPTKKPDDMAFEQFNDWLMKITCALFEVNPVDIGFNPKSGLGGKGFVEAQQQGSYDKGLLPLAQFISEIFTKLIKEEFGYDYLRFDFPTLKEKDAKAQAETNEILIRSGQRTIDELRTDEGMEALPDSVGARPFYAGQVTFLNEPDQPAVLPAQATQSESPPLESKPVPSKTKSVDHVELVTELRTFRKYALTRVKQGKSLRPFESEVLSRSTVSEINERLAKAATPEQVRGIFSEYMGDYQVNLISDLAKLREQIAEVV